MRAADVSLITCTFNDGHFVNGLLAGLAEWSLPPREVVVLDDGSDRPYAPPACPAPVRLLRHETNRGIPTAKHAAISAGTSPLLLFMDCDTRVEPGWLEACLPHAARPEVGMVSGPVGYVSGEDLVSRFQRCFGDNHNQDRSGAVEFIPGNAFLLRRETWEACGGLADFRGEVCEDHFLCAKLRRAGLLLWVEERARARQIRRINRAAMLKRYWKWCHTALKEQALTAGAPVAYVFSALAMPHAQRVETAIAREEPLFLYLEAAYLSFAVLDLLDHLAARDRAHPGLKAAWWTRLDRLFGRLPVLRAVLRADLARLGQTPPPAAEDLPGDPWEPCFAALDALAGSGVYEWLNRAGVPAMLEEEKTLSYDFSFYEHVSLESGPTD